MEGPAKAPRPTIEKIKDWAKISALIGASFVAGKVVIETHQSPEQEGEYANYLEHSMTQQEKDALDDSFEQIKKYFGKGAVDDIRRGDRTAFFERQAIEQTEIPYIGFDNAGITSQSVKQFTSEETFFPKNFIDGEVGGFYFSESGLETNLGETEGMFGFEHNAIVIFLKKADAPIKQIDKVRLLWHIKDITSHELGHANDWENDMESTLKERVELLRKIGERLKSEDKFISREARRGDPEYYESQSTDYKKAKEYWAEICKEYFGDPISLKEEFPEDFEIVDAFVRKQDPNFDIFKVGGPYFDRFTGDLLKEWGEFTNNAIEAK